MASSTLSNTVRTKLEYPAFLPCNIVSVLFHCMWQDYGGSVVFWYLDIRCSFKISNNTLVVNIVILFVQAKIWIFKYNISTASLGNPTYFLTLRICFPLNAKRHMKHLLPLFWTFFFYQIFSSTVLLYPHFHLLRLSFPLSFYSSSYSTPVPDLVYCCFDLLVPLYLLDFNGIYRFLSTIWQWLALSILTILLQGLYISYFLCLV